MLKCLAEAQAPLSLGDIERSLDTVDRSSVFRVLTIFLTVGIVHEIDDGSKSVKYELCRASDEHDSDRHVHFHCTSCQRTFCLEEVPVPTVQLPSGYLPHTSNFVIKGVCPECNK